MTKCYYCKEETKEGYHGPYCDNPACPMVTGDYEKWEREKK